MASIFRVTILLLVSVLTLGCSETRFEEATGKGQIRGINGIVNTSDVAFLIEERNIGQLSYKGASTLQDFDDLSYTFNFDLPIPRESNRRIARQFVDVARDVEYTIVLAGPVDAPEVVVWERPVPEWDGTETVLDIGAGHVNTSIGEVDVYFLTPGTAPALGDALGSVDFGGRIADVERPAGDYEIVLTAKDDPATILFASLAITLAPASSYTIVAFDADPSITAPISVRLISLAGNALELADINFPATAQFVNAAFGSGNTDVVADGDFANPLITDLPFGTVSPDVDIVPGPVTYSYTPTGNTMPLYEEDLGVLQGTRTTVFLLGEVGDLDALALSSDRRGFSTVARFRLTNASFNSQNVDIYFTAPGESIDDRLPNFSALPFGIPTDLGPQFAEEFELTVTRDGEKTPLVGPQAITFNIGDVVEIALLDTADPNVAELLIFSNISP